MFNERWAIPVDIPQSGSIILDVELKGIPRSKRQKLAYWLANRYVSEYATLFAGCKSSEYNGDNQPYTVSHHVRIPGRRKAVQITITLITSTLSEESRSIDKYLHKLLGKFMVEIPPSTLQSLLQPSTPKKG